MQIKTGVIYILVTLGVLSGVVGLLWKFGSESAKPIEGVAGERRHVRGEGGIEIVEFSDFQCPACRTVEEPLAKMMKKYEGKVKLIYRHFPLTTAHKNAFLSAQAAEAAGKQNKFWEMHDKLFVEQANWEQASEAKTLFVEYAKELNLDINEFLVDFEEKEGKQAINLDLSEAVKYRLRGTPSFFVNGVKTEFGEMEKKIEELTK